MSSPISDRNGVFVSQPQDPHAPVDAGYPWPGTTQAGYPSPQPNLQVPYARQPPPGQYVPYPPPVAPRSRFAGLAWTGLVLGIVGVIGSPVILLNNLTAVIAAVGVVLSIIALFGTRRILAAVGAVLCIAGIGFTVAAQGAAVAELDRTFGNDPTAVQDVAVSDCRVVDKGFGLVMTEATIRITNSTDQSQTYSVTVSVNDDSGNRVGEVNAFSNNLAPGQSVTINGTGTVNDGTKTGTASCQVADVNRFGS